MSKLTRAQIERERYSLALKFTDDRKLARKARGWSLHERWEQAFGNKFRAYAKSMRERDKNVIPHKPSKRKVKVYTSKEEYLRVKRERYATLRRLGFSSRDANRNTSDVRFTDALAKAQRKEREKQKKDPKTNVLAKRLPSEIERRKKQWSKWAREKKFPQSIIDLVHAVNRKAIRKTDVFYKDVPEDAGYGFGVVYYYYVMGGSLDSLMRKLEIDAQDYDKYVQPNFRALGN